MSIASSYRGIGPPSSSETGDRMHGFESRRPVTRRRVPQPLTKPKPDASPLAHGIYYYLTKSGRSASEISRQINRDSSYIRNILNGSSQNPSSISIQKIADALDVKAEVLMNFKEVTATAPEPSFGLSVKPSQFFPLFEAEYALLEMVRRLKQPDRDRVLNFASSLLPNPKPPAKRGRRSKRD